MQLDATRAHYERLADEYDENWAYSPTFIAWMTENLLNRLKVTSEIPRLLDIGCGTGLYTRNLEKHTSTTVCADLSPAMLRRLPASERLIPLVAAAEDLATGRIRLPHDGYDAILMKEVIHHLDAPARVLHGLSRYLRPGGRMLVVMLPSAIDYPLFEAALRLFRAEQPAPEHIASAMRGAGLRTELTYDEFPLTFTVERYLQMVRSRYMSLLSSFDDAELESGISEIRLAHPGPEVRFPDRFAFILGVKA